MSLAGLIPSFAQIGMGIDQTRKDNTQNLLATLANAKLAYTDADILGKTQAATGDILKSIELLTALRKIHALFGEAEEAKKIKTTIDALQQKISEMEKEEDQKKKKI